MKTFKKIASILMIACLALPFVSCSTAPQEADIAKVFQDTSAFSYSTDYTELKANKTNSTDAWRQGMISGNGLQGVITSGAPYSDSLIFQNMHFILPNQNVRYCPDTADELPTVKQHIVNGEDIVDDASYDDVYSFHPGGALRIDQDKKRLQDYLRYTNYETAEVGVRYTDENGTWERLTFTSRADNATFTKITQSSNGEKLNLTLSFDDISAFANYGKGKEVDLQYKKIAFPESDALGFVAHYPNYENSELKNGGYATVTYVVTENGNVKTVMGDEVKDEQYAAAENPQLQITDADAVYLVTVSDRTYDMGAYDDFAGTQEYELTNELYARAKETAQKYLTGTALDYDAALQAHLALYTPQYSALSLSLQGGGSMEANEDLIRAQKGEDTISSALAERAYQSGRYAYLCSGGYSTPRLYGMWTGEWDPGWGSKYTMDANVNLQTSSMNSGNMSESYTGYAYFILRQLPDWEENAMATHGYTDAIQAPVNTDGDKAVITETCYPYPFRYWNAGTSWMILPLYETLLSWGNVQIPLSDEIDLDALRSVLSPTADDLTDAQISEIEARGYLRLEEDILLPLLTKSANYWDQMLTPEYYTDAEGNIHYEAGKTMLERGETYCILPSYSPENNPKNYPSPSDANAAIDIAACRSNLQMLIDVLTDLGQTETTGYWQTMIDQLPPYLFDETGALKEWACNQFEENNEHRHLSHLYCAWPLNETQDDAQLTKACLQAIANRESENEASHALVHRSLIAARLKDRTSLTEALLDLMNHKIYYDSLMTNHDYDRGSCYCTDFAIGYLGIINESLVYSDTGRIEILPALPESGFDAGTLKGLRTRTRAVVTDLTWDTTAKTASVTIESEIDQTIEVSCGLNANSDAQSVTLKAGESRTIQFTL